MRILIADDDHVNCLVLQKFLQKWGYEVVIARDGTEACKTLTQPDSPRMAILDWMMPYMDGVQVCRQIRKQQDPSYTYIILLTGKGQTEDIVQGLDAGADDYILKPFEPSELRAR